MNIRKIKIANLKPAEYNPRIDLKPENVEYQRIKRSLVEFGYVAPIIVNTDMTVISGHQRLKVLKELDICGMSVPPIMMKKIANEIKLQFLDCLKK